jgi:hypothetical protein
MKIRRFWGLLSVAVATVLVTTGCVKLEMDLTVSTDDKVSGTMVFALASSIADLAEEGAEASQPMSTDGLFANAENVTIEPFDDGKFVGSSYSFENIPLEQLAPEVGENSALLIQREGDNLVVAGVLDTSTEGAEGESNPLADSLTESLVESTSIKISITLPGKIQQTNGVIDGQTITWTGKFGEKLDIQAVSISPLAAPINWFLFLGILGLILAVAGGVGVWMSVISKSKNPTSKKTSKASSKASQALDQRPWYQKKRFALPAVGGLALSLFLVALGLMLPAQDSNNSADRKSSSATSQRDKDAKASGDGSGEGEAAQETEAAAPAPAQPAPAPPAPKPAPPAPSSKEASAQVADEELETEGQYWAREDAYTFWYSNWYSRSGLINELVNTMGHSYADAEYGVDFQGINWSVEAFGMATTFIGDYYHSYQSLFNTLIGEGFSAAEAEYGVNALEWDWFREAYLYGVDLFDQGYLEEDIYNELIGMGFSDDEAFYGSYFAANPE